MRGESKEPTADWEAERQWGISLGRSIVNGRCAVAEQGIYKAASNSELLTICSGLSALEANIEIACSGIYVLLLTSPTTTETTLRQIRA